MAISLSECNDQSPLTISAVGFGCLCFQDVYLGLSSQSDIVFML